MLLSASNEATCPDEDELVLYLEAHLAPEDAARIEEHLDTCGACHRVLAAVAQADSRAVPSGSGEAEIRGPHVAARQARRGARRVSTGAVLGRYVVGEALGEGGMGVVYAARDTELDRDVALKVVTTDGPDASGLRKRLLREARLAAQLRHPNVVAIHDVGEADGCAYLAMELVRGRSLRAYVGDASVPLRARLGWLVDVARALAAAHARGLVHRDVKPENVMIDETGAVRVVDFGIARSCVPEVDAASAKSAVLASTITQKGALVGTPAYMAPEQLRDEPVDARIDQFAWGVLAYELFSGARPWTGKALAMVSDILTVDPPPLPEHVPRAVGAVVRKALAKAPDGRFASMDALVSALAPFASAEGALRSRRSRLWTWAAACAIGAAGVVGLVAVRASTGGSVAAPPAETVAAPTTPTAPLALPQETPPGPIEAPMVRPPSPRPSSAGPTSPPRATSLSASAPRPASSVDLLDFRK